MDALETNTDKFTAARIRLFQATGMANQRTLPFDRQPKLAPFKWKPAMLRATQPARRRRERKVERIGA